MHRVLYIDATDDAGVARFRSLEELFNDVAWLHCNAASSLADCLAGSNRWDLLVVDLRGLSDAHRNVVQGFVDANPDAVLVLVAEAFDRSTAEAILELGAVECMTWDRGCEKLVKILRRTLARLTIAYAAITRMNNRIEEFDTTLSVGLSEDCANSLANYTLRHVAQMDVCGLRKQFRAVRAFEEALKQIFRNELEALANNPSGDEGKHWQADSVSEDVFARARIRLSQDGFRFTLRSTHGTCDLTKLWFAPLYMDEISVDPERQEMTMLLLPDEVCQHVSQAIERCLDTIPPNRNLLTDALNTDLTKIFPVRSAPLPPDGTSPAD